jgi:hypothetical protein
MGVRVRGGSALVTAAYATAGVLVGAAGAFLSLEVPLVGVVLATAAGVLLVRRASCHRWLALGGFLLGLGAVGAGFLSPALTNHDPAVAYDPSTVPFFIIGVVIALSGAVTLAVATRAIVRRRLA